MKKININDTSDWRVEMHDALVGIAKANANKGWESLGWGLNKREYDVVSVSLSEIQIYAHIQHPNKQLSVVHLALGHNGENVEVFRARNSSTNNLEILTAKPGQWCEFIHNTIHRVKKAQEEYDAEVKKLEEKEELERFAEIDDYELIKNIVNKNK